MLFAGDDVGAAFWASPEIASNTVIGMTQMFFTNLHSDPVSVQQPFQTVFIHRASGRILAKTPVHDHFSY